MMSRFATADMIQSTEDCLAQEGRHADQAMELNTSMNAAEGMQLLSRDLISQAVWRRANKYIFYQHEETPLDTAVQDCNVKFLNVFFDCVVMDEQVKIRMVSNSYNNFFLHHEFSQITNDHVAMVKRLLELGADVNGGPSVFPLSVATISGSYPLVQLLCQHGADLNKTDETFGYPPLSIAAEGGFYDIIEVLLKFGANMHDKVLWYSPFDLALVHGHTDCAKLLLQHGAKFYVEGLLYSLVHNQSVVYINFLLMHCKQETQEYICKHQQDLLLSAVNGTNIDFINHIIDTVFDITGQYPCLEKLLAESGNKEIASYLIRKGANVNKLVETCGGYTPLHLVLCREDMCQSPKLQIVKVLLENGASPNTHGDTSPLMIAALGNNSTDLLQLLLDYGADINWKDNKHDTAFSYAVYQGCDSNAEFLITCIKDKHFINSQNNEGLTVLMQAARYSNVAVVRAVINHNPDMNMTDENGNTALLHAINRTENDDKGDGADDIVTILINAGCDVNLQNDDGLSPLMLAASRYSRVTIQVLLDAGADINAVSKTDKSKTAVSYFQPMSHIYNNDITACLEVFLDQGACLSYLQPKMFHRILLCNDSDIIRKFIINVTGPVTVSSDEYFNYFSPADPTFDVSPLCTALLSGNALLARHFVDIMWLTKSDLTLLAHNKPVRSYLQKKNLKQCLNLLDELSSQPVSLFKLAFVEVSSAVGTFTGREERVNALPVPWLLKDKLLFNSPEDFKTPAIDRIPIRLLPSDPSPDVYVSVHDCCKCCRVRTNFKLKRQFKNKYPCFTCHEHNCSECLAISAANRSSYLSV